MSKLTRYILAATALLALSLAGLFALSAPGHHEHAAAMDEGSASCITYCLRSGGAPDTAPLVPPSTLMMTSLLVTAIFGAMLAVVRLTQVTYAARPRPSPDLVKLYAHYLD